MKRNIIDYIPKKYKERIETIEKMTDLTDDLKYMLYFADGWTWEGFPSVPIKNIKEALQFIKESTKEV